MPKNWPTKAASALTRATLASAIQGNLRTTTPRGFGEKGAIVGSLP